MTKPLPRILLVDDEPNNLLLLEELLHSQGYETLIASSGIEALEVVKDFQPDLILLDVMMPDMGGFEVCRRLREDAELRTVPVIFLTALDDEESHMRGLEMLGDDYITKPIKTTFLLKKIANTLRLIEMRSQESAQRTQEEIKEKTKRQLSAAWQINEYLSEKFRLFVPDQFLSRIAPKGVESIQLGNAREEELTVLFCDIREFTAIAEAQTASDTFEWLNAFFTQMNQAIATNHGFIDKFLGDALMAVFDRTGNHAQDALSAAVMMVESLNQFNRDRQQYNLEQPVNVGIGIHTGVAMIGTVGSDRRMDSTVIGDVVNTAARLEELTKLYGCRILASDAAIAQMRQPELFSCRLIDRVTPRGKQQAVDLYEVLSTQTHLIHQAKLLY
ncbi:adenylate/guanylate cyclase domain-containing protein [Coleofasciculus sp. FACHB-1120]|uniref:response regulator n=1 Tax=Coleofasciculus sp. FACHB-1120 TaxID=2692783 RepID=UPI001685CE8B|nr:adenylate/guanylate cyclase domain-containing protein [Coleofasciculus sp. FACHB-1120]MBD2742800.1 response regulator [Coleofasciculus sp. FACHB-1120]